MPKSTRSKEEIYFMVLNAILKMEIAKGHLKWTLSDISRESKVTRSLIYYYFGKEKKAVLATAYQYLVERFYSLDKPNPLPLRQRLSNILKDLKEMLLVTTDENSRMQLLKTLMSLHDAIFHNWTQMKAGERAISDDGDPKGAA